MTSYDKNKILKIIENVKAASDSPTVVIICPEEYKDEYIREFGSDTIQILKNSFNDDSYGDKVIIIPTDDKPIKFVESWKYDIDFKFPKSYGTWNCVNSKVNVEGRWKEQTIEEIN